MKKLFLAVLLVALFVFTSCNSDEPVTKATPLTIELLDVGTITISNPPSTGMWYSINGGTLKEVTDEPIKAKTGTRISLYANGTENSYKKVVLEQLLNIDCSADFYVYGNVMSLIDSDNFENLAKVPPYAFYGLFGGDSHLHNHDSKDLLLPATILADFCYQYMFEDCTSLAQAPALPAQTLADYCYQYMFSGCTSLTQAPELPSTTLADCCYANMFEGCTSLTKAPELPATTLVEGCYSYMFESCTSLTKAPELPATTLVKECYKSMFKGCTSLTSVTCLATTATSTSTQDWLNEAGTQVEGQKIFYHADGITWLENDTYGVPTGWTQKPMSEKQ